MRPLGPSMSAGLSLISVNELKMKSVSETSGIVTSGYGPRKIIIHFFWSAPAERSGDGALDYSEQSNRAARSKAPSPLRSAGALQRADTIHDPAALIAAKLYSEGR